MHKYLWISALIIALDQLTKITAEYTMMLGQTERILPIFSITLVYNHGAAFGFLSDQGGWQRWFLLLLATGLMAYLLRWLMKLKAEEKLTAIALCLILGGAIGNVIDRSIYGYVIDFIDFNIGNYHWPTFNIADCAIVIGAGLMITDMWQSPKKGK